MFFIVGNAAFHSKELYGALAPCLRPLTAALSDPDEKTRANSAGAIGNLVRNSGELSGLIAQLPVVERLLGILVADGDITTQRIALFSVGTMAVYPATREKLLEAQSPSLTAIFTLVQEKYSHDDVMMKYVTRLKQKLKQPVQSTG